MSLSGANVTTGTDLTRFASAPAGRSLWSDAFSRLSRNRTAMGCALFLGAIVLAAIVVPWISAYNYYTPEWTLLDVPPTWHGGHIFGTDDLGRDLLVRIMWGCRVSLLIGKPPLERRNDGSAPASTPSTSPPANQGLGAHDLTPALSRTTLRTCKTPPREGRGFSTRFRSRFFALQRGGC